MPSTSKQIQDHYIEHFDELDFDHAFHLCSRLILWQQDNAAAAKLAPLIARTKPSDDTQIKERLQALLAEQPDASVINAWTTRKQHFARLPRLFGIHQALFQIKNWLVYYGIDARDQFAQLVPESTHAGIAQTLLNDNDTLFALSTYGVNYLYLYHHLLRQDPTFDLLSYAPSSLPMATKEQRLLSAYLVTHAVIGETLFYIKPIPGSKLQGYRDQLWQLLLALGSHIEELSLDAQLEIVVAAKICGLVPRPPYNDISHSSSPAPGAPADLHRNDGYASDTSDTPGTTADDRAMHHNRGGGILEHPVLGAILARATSCYDPSLGYITDPNKPTKNTLAAAEHRNVLYIMASSSFDPPAYAAKNGPLAGIFHQGTNR